jgi:Tfp pilus assembly protein PilE
MIEIVKTSKINKCISNNKGSTMVETLVAFVVLSIILLIIYRAVVFCSELKLKTIDTDIVMDKFNAEIYKEDDKINASEVESKSYSMISDKGPVFYIMLDADNEEMMDKNVKDSVTDYDNLKLRMNKIEATGYKSVNPLIDSENLTTPKALQFTYKE